MITWNGFSLNNGGSTLIPKDTHYPIVTGSGFVFGIFPGYTGTLFDPWYNAIKDYTGSYIETPDPYHSPYPIPNNYQVEFPQGTNSVYLSDEAWSATSAQPDGNYYSEQRYCLDRIPTYFIYEIRQFDFWHQKKFSLKTPAMHQSNCPLQPSCKLPTDSGLFKRGENITAFDLCPLDYPEHSNWPVSDNYPNIKTRTWFCNPQQDSPIEPFITAIKEACPHVNGCGSLKYNWSTDYDHCKTAYPDWYL